ncbi:MAG: hypothetical protein DDT33_01780 [Firmicutes bacterium]|nr:hypothetical protein [Bacillota bacterium]
MAPGQVGVKIAGDEAHAGGDTVPVQQNSGKFNPVPLWFSLRACCWERIISVKYRMWEEVRILCGELCLFLTCFLALVKAIMSQTSQEVRIFPPRGGEFDFPNLARYKMPRTNIGESLWAIAFEPLIRLG